MGFKCGIIGLPNVGKSTLFNALTSSNKAEAANYPFATIEPNIGRVPVPDIRLKKLSKINTSKKTIPTFMDFVDIAGLVKGASKGEGLGNKFLSHIRGVDAILHIVRCFENENISHVSNNIDPINDIETINTELLLADLEILLKRKESLIKKSKSGDMESEKILNLVNCIIENMEKGEDYIKNIKGNSEKQIINDLNLITYKPLMYVCNVDERSIMNGNNLSKKVKEKIENKKNVVVNISASVESQIANLEKKEDQQLFLEDLNLKEPALNKVIRSGYDLLNLITFFTTGFKETRAWTIEKDSKASNAAGKNHTDIEKGFIRAETISYNDYIKFNGELGCKENGKLRQEGKDYKVEDGDIFNFLFNV